MKNPVWFSPYGWTYKPSAPAGYLLAAIGLLFALQILAESYLAYRSLSAMLFISFPYVVSIAVVYTWVASKTCQK